MFAKSRPLLSPDSPAGGAAFDYARDSYVALVRVLHEPPAGIPHASAIWVCATNFSNDMIPALKSGRLSPGVALKYLALSNPFSGVNVFVETKQLQGLVAGVSEAIIELVDGGAAVSTSTLAALRGYVASPQDVGVNTSLIALKAMLAGCSRCFTVSTSSQLEPRVGPDPIAEVVALAPELRWVGLKYPSEIAEVVVRIGELSVSSPLAKGLDRVLLELSDPSADIPAEVQHAARLARARRASDPLTPG